MKEGPRQRGKRFATCLRCFKVYHVRLGNNQLHYVETRGRLTRELCEKKEFNPVKYWYRPAVS